MAIFTTSCHILPVAVLWDDWRLLARASTAKIIGAHFLIDILGLVIHT